MSAAFIERLNAGAESLVRTGASHFVQALIFALVLALIDALVGRRMGAHWRGALWLLFFVKLALPPQLALPSSPAYWWRAPATVRAPATGLMPAPGATLASAADWSVRETNRPAAAPAPAPTSLPLMKPTWQLLLVLGWAVGLASLAGAMLVQGRRTAAMLRQTVPAGDSLCAALERARGEVALRRRVRLRLCDGPIGPLVCGLWRPTIYLPRTLAFDLAPAQLHAVLIHELLHVKRGDLWITALQATARVVFFHHPAVWWVNAHLARIREEATDRAVLSHRTVDARAYSLALVAAAEFAVRGQPITRFALGVIETKSQLRKRIQMNLQHPRSRRAHLGLPGVLSLAALGVVLVPMAPAGSPTTGRATPAGFKPVDPNPVVRQIDAASAKIFSDFNRRDRAAYLAAFTEDTLMLPPGTPMLTGQIGAADSYLRTPAGLQYERMAWTDRQAYRIGPWLVETGAVDFQFRPNVDAPTMSDPRQALTIWEEGPDGALRVKVLSWNPLPHSVDFSRPTAPQAFECSRTGGPFTGTGDFKAVLQAEEAFHRAFETQHGHEAASYYAEQAVLLSPDAGLVRGQPEIQRLFEGIASDRFPKRIEHQAVHVEGNENHVLVVNLFRWTFTAAGAEAPVTITGKGVHLWQRSEDGTWRILFDLPNPSQRSAG